MAFEEVSRVEVIEILRRWQTGDGVRALARGTGLSRNTIRKYIEAAERCGLTRDGPSPTDTQLTELVRLNVAGPRQTARPAEEVLAPWATRVREWLDSERLTLTRVHELLKEQHCTVSYMSLYRYAMRREWREEILNYFDHPYTNGFLEGKNNRIKVIKRTAYGYRNHANFRQRIMLTNRQEAQPIAA